MSHRTEKRDLLIVDADAAGRQALRALLTDYTVVEASGCAEALALLRARTAGFAAVLGTIDKSGGTAGLALLDACRQDAALSSLPFLAVTGSGDKALQELCLAHGAADFVTVPLSGAVLAHRLQNVLTNAAYEKQRLERKLYAASQQLDAIVDSLPGGVATYVFDGSHYERKLFNDSLCTLSGYSAREFNRRTKADPFALIHPEDRAELRRVLQECSSRCLPIEHTYRIVRQNGTLLWIKLIAKFMHTDDKGRPVYQGLLLDVTREQEVMRELAYRAERDLLTGIYNRETFCLRAAEMLHANPAEKHIVLRWNIDNFKLINDLFGSKTGDKVLLQAAGLLDNTLQGIGVYGRFASDHFVACLPARELQIESFAQSCEDCFRSLGLDYHITISIGLYEVDDIELPVELMCDRANIALHTIKGNYFRRYAWYDDTLRSKLISDQNTLNAAGDALEQGEFTFYLQPVFDVLTRRIVSAEALVRWISPERGVISPGEFIPVLESSGFITKVDFSIWEQTCAFLRSRLDAGLPVVPLSVNVSRLNLYNPRLCDIIVSLTNKYDIDPSLLRLEITESAYMESQAQLLEIANELRAHGFKILMDDFGSGYSSLTLLKDMPVDVLKIDRGFITDIGNSQRAGNVLSSIVRLAKWLDIPVVAEGVETQSQFDFVTGIGCCMIQGFYFSRPVPREIFCSLLDAPQQAGSELPAAGQSLLSAAHPRTVMVIDDNSVNRLIVKKQLGGIYNIVEANNGKEALSILTSIGDHIDVILLDLVMPVLNGYDFLTVMKGDPAISDIPVIVLTSSDTADTEVKVLEFGANDFLRKPLEPSSLRLRIANMIELSENIRRRQSAEQVIKNIPGGVLIYEIREGHIGMRYASDGIESVSGYSAADYLRIYGSDATRVLLPEDRERVLRFFADRAQERQPIDISYRAVMPDGSLHWRNVRAKFAYVDGEDNIYFGVISDITEQHNAQLELERSRSELLVSYSKLQIAIDHSDLDIWEYELNNRCFVFPANVVQKFSLPQSRIPLDAALTLEDFIHPEDRALVSDAVARASRGDSPVELSVRLCGQQKEFRWYNISMTVVFGADGKPVSAMGIARDVTDEVNLRIEYEKETRYRRSQLHDAILLLECDLSTQELLNKDALPKLGLPPQATLREVHSLLARRIVHPEDRYLFHIAADTDTLAREVVEGKHDATFECRMLSPTGSYIGYHWVSATFSFIVNPGTGHPHVFMSVKDINNRKLEEISIQERAQRDSLTKLLNRATFEEFVNSKLRNRDTRFTYAFLIIDIDDFKRINDTCGHTYGDEVLRKAAQGIRSMFRSDDILGRMGGDELAVFMTGLPDKDVAFRKGEELCRSVSYGLQSDKYPVTCSVGIAISPEHGTSFADLYHNADVALYRAKQLGKNQCCVYNTERKHTSISSWMNKEWLLDAVQERILINSRDNYDLLYLNRAAQEKYGALKPGVKCYELCRHRTSPCEQCTNRLVNFDDFYCWEAYGQTDTALMREKLILWDGKVAKLSIEVPLGHAGVEVTQRDLAELSHRVKTRREELLRLPDTLMVADNDILRDVLSNYIPTKDGYELFSMAEHSLETLESGSGNNVLTQESVDPVTQLILRLSRKASVGTVHYRADLYGTGEVRDYVEDMESFADNAGRVRRLLGRIYAVTESGETSGGASKP